MPVERYGNIEYDNSNSSRHIVSSDITKVEASDLENYSGIVKKLLEDKPTQVEIILPNAKSISSGFVVKTMLVARAGVEVTLDMKDPAGKKLVKDLNIANKENEYGINITLK